MYFFHFTIIAFISNIYIYILLYILNLDLGNHSLGGQVGRVFTPSVEGRWFKIQSHQVKD